MLKWGVCYYTNRQSMIPLLKGLLVATALANTTITIPPPTQYEPVREVIVEQVAELNSTSTVRNYVEQEAIKVGVDPKMVYSIVNCESGFVPQQSKHLTKTGEQEDSWGVWQIHLPSHPTITREQAMDVEWSTNWSLGEIKKGNAYLWSCWHKLQT